MISTYIDACKRDLIREMGERQLEPLNAIIYDGEPHEYEAYIDGQHCIASYSATLSPFEDDSNGPVLICSYGLRDKSDQYTYTSLKMKRKQS